MFNLKILKADSSLPTSIWKTPWLVNLRLHWISDPARGRAWEESRVWLVAWKLTPQADKDLPFCGVHVWQILWQSNESKGIHPCWMKNDQNTGMAYYSQAAGCCCTWFVLMVYFYKCSLLQLSISMYIHIKHIYHIVKTCIWTIRGKHRKPWGGDHQWPLVDSISEPFWFGGWRSSRILHLDKHGSMENPWNQPILLEKVCPKF